MSVESKPAAVSAQCECPAVSAQMSLHKTEMPVEEGEFTDGLGRNIKTFKWGVEGEPKALVFFCHG